MFGFQHDFDLFRARGRIGSVLSIQVATLTPEIGTVCPVTFRTYGLAAWASIDGQGRFAVRDNEVVNLRMRSDRPVRIQLIDASGQDAQVLVLTPEVAQPELAELTLPPTVTYGDGHLSANVSARNAQRTTISYAVAAEDNGQVNWVPVPLTVNGNFQIPLIASPHELSVRVELESKHAHLSRRARCVIERHVSVKHPQPQCQVLRTTPLRRFEKASIPLAFRWVKSVRIVYEGHTADVQIVNAGLFHDEVQVNTASVGTQRINVTVEGLDGVVEQRVVDIDVLARRLSVKIGETTPSLVDVTIEGATRARLVIPTALADIAIPSTGGRIFHGFCLPTHAAIHVTDDLNKEHTYPVVLASVSRYTWAPLPQMTQLLDWRF